MKEQATCKELAFTFARSMRMHSEDIVLHSLTHKILQLYD